MNGRSKGKNGHKRVIVAAPWQWAIMDETDLELEECSVHVTPVAVVLTMRTTDGKVRPLINQSARYA